MKNPPTNLFSVLLFSVLLHSSALANPTIDKARGFLDDLRFEDAQQAAEKSLSSGSNEPAQVAALYMLLGEVAASLGDKAQARTYFHNALSIDSDLALPDNVSPKLGKPFLEAKASLEAAEPISLAITKHEEGLLTITVVSDPANLIKGARISYQLEGETSAETGLGRDEIEIEVPEGADDMKLSGIDGSGNRLTEFREIESSVEVAPKPIIVQTAGPAIYSRWQIYAGLALGFAASGTYFGFKARSIADELEGLEDGTEYSQARTLEDRGKKKALYANISFAGAGLLTVVSAVLYHYQGKDSTERLTLVPQLSAEHIGAAAIIHF